jgi:hypothetical protein
MADRNIDRSSSGNSDIDGMDPIISRVRDTLAPTPRVDASDVARMLMSVHARRRTLRERLVERIWFMRIPSVSVVGATSLAVLALSAGFIGRGAFDRDTPTSAVANTDGANANANDAGRALDTINSAARAALVAADSPDEIAIPVQFVLNVANAQSVALVGDFNAWDATAEPLERVNNSSLWTTTRNLKPGRHVYAYVVDGTKWIRDPRAAEAQDEDFGRPQSVIVVQTPWSGR